MFSVICIIGIGLGFSCGNFVFLAKALVELTGLPYGQVIILIYVFILFMLMIIREPERIKPIAFFFTMVILSIGSLPSSAIVLMLTNYVSALFLVGHDSQIEYNYSNFAESEVLIGIALFSFEAINTVVNVRRTTKVPANMRFYVKVTRPNI